VVGFQKVLCPPAPEQPRGIGDQYLVAAGRRFALAQYQNACGESGTIEQVRCQPDHRLDQVHPEQRLTDAAFRSFAKERALRQHDRHAAGPLGHRLDHMLDPGKITARGGRQTGKVASEWIIDPLLFAPLLQREGWIGEYAIEGGEPVAGKERGVAQGVAAQDLEILDPMQKQIHPGDGRGGEILLLPVQLSPQPLHVAVLILYMGDGRQ
jgi:hypothetical protein